MKFLLAAINAKFIHSNPAIYSLAAFAQKRLPQYKNQIELSEYTINQPMHAVLSNLYFRRPDAVGFSCYIWNIEYVFRLVTELKKILPDTEIWLGGPEVSYDAETILEAHPQIRGIMIGEGEETFTELLSYYANRKEESRLDKVSGIAFRNDLGRISFTEQRPLAKISSIPFLYEDPKRFENKIIYYESSRGCPFRCSYCLSSIDKQVRFRDLEIVKKELQFFLDHKVKQVKFIDRTFNCSHEHAMTIWEYIRDHDNGTTNFHFEIAGDLLTEEELELIRTLRPGAVQMEIGVQSTNGRTIQEIERTMDKKKLAGVVKQLHESGNVHIHLDLIAGLPYEDYESFANSFNEVFAMKPEQLQLGFLKVLKGSKMYQNAEEYGLVYSDAPPYEVLFTKWISFEEIQKLKKIEEMVEIYYNSNQYRTTLPFLLREFTHPFAFFEALAAFYEKNHYFIMTPARAYRYEILLEFAKEYMPKKADLIREMLVVDYYLRENAKARPGFAKEGMKKEVRHEFYQKESVEHHYLTGEIYRGLSAKELSGITHIEPINYDLHSGKKKKEQSYVLFDYQKRNPLTHEAKSWLA